MSKNGFTLLELVITTAVGSLIGGLLIMILVNNAGIFYKQSSKVAEGVGSNDALLNINTSVKGASSVVIGYPENSPTYTTGPSVLALKLPSIDGNSQIISNSFDYIVYTLESGNLRVRIFPSISPASSRKSQDRVLTGSVSNVLFKYLDSSGNEITPISAVKVVTTLTLKQKSAIDYEIKVATSEASLRND